MDNADIFYILGGTLAVLAVIVSFLGLRNKNFPPSKALMSGLIALFAVLVAGTAAFAVASARDEQAHREHEEAEQAKEDAEAEEITQAEAGGAEGQAGGGEPAGAAGGEPAGGEATTLQLAADETNLAFDETALQAKPGELTIEFDNPAGIPHNVAIQQGGEILAESQTVTQSNTSVSADLKPGRYEFLCTVPGHAEGGMTGILQVG